MNVRGGRRAFGAPGIEPRWTHSNKDAIGTAYSSDSKVWYTLWRGIVTECYFPLIDRPQIRDLELLVTDHETFFHEEKRHLETRIERLTLHALGYRIRSRDPQGRYQFTKTVISHPHLPCLLQRIEPKVAPEWRGRLDLYVLLAPHLDGGGWGNTARVWEVAGRSFLAAEKNGVAVALAADVPFRRLSCGYVGASDGYTDLAQNRVMDWEFDEAPEGNVALTGELEASAWEGCTISMAFGRGIANATHNLLQSLCTPFEDLVRKFEDQWERETHHQVPLETAAVRSRTLYHASHALLLAHEDKTFPGAFIASLSIPWGEAKGDEDRGGYHLVWVRDLYHTASGLLAAGNTETARRILIYLAASQQSDGGFPQNFWVNGEAYWKGIQLDEVSYPILLAWKLSRENALGRFDPYPMVLAAAGYLVRHGPATQQERWEEASGYSPSTLAVNIAALLCAAQFARQRGDEETAVFLEDHTDFLESHLEAWTVTRKGTLHPSIRRHYIRILPVDLSNPEPIEDPDEAYLTLANVPPGEPATFPARDIVDAGFLELVRWGIRSPHDPLVEDSLRVVDHVLRVETALGPGWHRYNHDGYGQRADGGPFVGYGQGRVWPLLTGERAHYEIAAGRDPTRLIETLEKFATRGDLLPEQVWDEADRPDLHLYSGRPTGSATPLLWAHAEYITLLRSRRDGSVFDLIPEVRDRYRAPRRSARLSEIWSPHRHARQAASGRLVRIEAPEPFRLHWSSDLWKTVTDTASHPTRLGLEYVDLQTPEEGAGLSFTFYWTRRSAWEGRDYFLRSVSQGTG